MKAKLIRLRLTNIASYGNKYNELNFEELNYPVLVTGPNGAGKTTFFVDGLTFALFKGAYDERLRSGQLIMPAGRRISSGEVELEWEINGVRYKVLRRGEREGDRVKWTALLYRSGGDGRWKEEAIGEEVNKRIAELLGMDYRTFLNSVVVRQGEVYSFIDKKDSERRDLLLDLLGLNLEKIRSVANERIREVSNRLSRIEVEIKAYEKQIKYKDVSEVENRLNVLRIEVANCDKKSKDLEEKIKAIEEKEEELKRSIVSYERDKSELSEYERRLLTIKGKLKTLGITHTYEVADELRELYEEVRSLSRDRDNILRDLSERKKTLDSLSKLRELREELEKANRELEALKEEARRCGVTLSSEFLGALKSEIEYLESEERKVMHYLNLLGTLSEPRCPLCGSTLNEERKKHILSNLNDALKQLDGKLKEKASLVRVAEELMLRAVEVNERIRKIEGEIGGLEASVGAFNEMQVRREIEKLTDECANVDEKLKRLLQKASALMGKECSLSELSAHVEKIKEAKAVLEDLKVVESRIKELKRALDLKRYEELKAEVRRLVEEKGRIEDELRETYRVKSKLETEIEELLRQKSLLEEVKKLRESKSNVEREKKILEYLKELVLADRRFPKALLKEITEELTAITNYYLQMMFPSASVSMYVSEDGVGVSLDIFIDNIKRDTATISGGEKVLIGFAIRLALSSLLSSLTGGVTPDFLIIDEGFGYLDEENKSLVVEAIGALYSSKVYSQIIVISHEPELKNHALFRDFIEVKKVNNLSELRLMKV